jgi:exodeoxyribonuclease VII large subunit
VHSAQRRAAAPPSRGRVLERARALAALSRAPAEHLARHRAALRQRSRELRASVRRRSGANARRCSARPASSPTPARRALRDLRVRRPAELERLRLALAAHDPERTLARGYALVEDSDAQPLTSAAAARMHRDVTLRFSDGRLAARIVSDDRRA